jgi:hypothetical protein
MTKFFRRHSRIFLLMFMAVLMVVFVIGDALSRGGSNAVDSDEQVGAARGVPVRQSHLRGANSDFEIARLMGMLPAGLEQLPRFADAGDVWLTIHLLAKEAGDLGISVSEAKIMQMMQQRGFQDSQFDFVRERFGLSRKGVFASLSRTLAIGVMFETQLEAALAVPLPQLQLAYRDRAQKASVKVSVIDAEAFVLQTDPPTEEQLLAHFEAGKDREDAHTPAALAYGYRLPDRIQLEYLTVDPVEIEPLVMIREADAVSFYEANKSKYQTEAVGPLAIGAATVQQTYEEARDRVREAVRSLEAIKEAQRLVNTIQAEALRSWVKAGEKAASESESFEALAARLSTPYQVKWEETDWIERGDFVTIPVLGGASRSDDRRRIPAADEAFNVEGLATDANLENSLKVNQPSPVFVTYRVNATGKSEPYQAVVFRVTGVKPAAPPDSIEQVRARLVENVRMEAAFVRAGNSAKAIASMARKSSLDEAVAQADDLRAILSEADESKAADEPEVEPQTRLAERTGYLDMLTPFSPPDFGRLPTLIRGIRSQLLTDRIFELDTAESDDGGVVVVPAADKHAWLVAERVELQPLYDGEFELARQGLEQQAAQTKFRSFQFEWCLPENVKKRAGYVQRVFDTASTDGADEADEADDTEAS